MGGPWECYNAGWEAERVVAVTTGRSWIQNKSQEPRQNLSWYLQSRRRKSIKSGTLITSSPSRLQQTKVLLKLREREGKRKSKWTNSLYCCKSSCYSDITKKLNLKQDRVNLVNLLFWFLETAKNMYLIGGLEAESESDVDINTSSLKCILQEIWQFDGLSWWWHYLLWWYGCWYFW